MSHDLVAVQRDAALLDALAQRCWVADPDQQVDPVAGLLAALAADADEGLADVVRRVVPPAIPVQRRHEQRQATVLALPTAIPPAGRRHVARAAAALFVTAALLSVSGVAAAVSGDPLTPYKRVVDVVRVGYHEVVPRRVLGGEPTVPSHATTVVTPRAERAAEKPRTGVGTRASTTRAGHRRSWDRHLGYRAGWHRTSVDRQQPARHHRHGNGWDGRRRSGGEPGEDGSGSHGTGFGNPGSGVAGSGDRGHGASGSGEDGRDSGDYRVRSGDSRR
jgi:hypothetical protein